MKRMSSMFFLFLIAFGMVQTDLYAALSTSQQEPQSPPTCGNPADKEDIANFITLKDQKSLTQEEAKNEDKQGGKERWLKNKKLIGGLFGVLFCGGLAFFVCKNISKSSS